MTRTTRRCIFRDLRTVTQILACALLLVQAALGLTKTSVPTPAVCSVTDLNVDETSDVQSMLYFKATIEQLFTAQKFAELDCIADAARVSKSRFASGGWKLRAIYWEVAEPEGHPTEEDWTDRLANLNSWVCARPESITARVALAEAYTGYAWNARGGGFSDTVTQRGWKLFEERIDKAKQILEQASKLKTKCPEWYVVMQTVALAECWNPSEATALLDQAVAFEPDYYYYYRQHATYLLPNWNGERGDAEKFVEQVAKHVGGGKGDILFFQIASHLICHGDPNFAFLAWARIQKGAAELEKQNGPSLINLNLLACVAIKQKNAAAARAVFSRLGDHWDKDTWKSRFYFDSSRTWASQRAGYEQDPVHLIIVQAQAKFVGAIRKCTAVEGADMSPFALILTLQKEGVVDAVDLDPKTKVGLCLMKLKGETVSPPPYAPFMFMIRVDPAEFVSPFPN